MPKFNQPYTSFNATADILVGATGKTLLPINYIRGFSKMTSKHKDGGSSFYLRGPVFYMERTQGDKNEPYLILSWQCEHFHIS